MPNPLSIGLAINPGLLDVVTPDAGGLQQLGAKWVRFLLPKRVGGNDQIQNFNTGQNSELDRLLARYQGANAQVLALINHETLGLSPDQMRADWNGAIQRVADLCEKITRFYGNRISAIEVLNEPDNFDPGTNFHRFQPEDYGLLLRESFNRIKAANPQLPVISAGLISPNTNYLQAALNAAGGAADGIGWHGYLRPVRGFPRPDWGQPIFGQDLEDAVREVRNVGGKPIWITEIGISLDGEISEAKAAEYVGRALPALHELGTDVVSHVFWFTWKFPPSVGEPGHDFGLVDPMGNRRPAWTAYQQAVQNIEALSRRVPLPPSIIAVNFNPTSLEPGQVLQVTVTVRNDSDEPLTTQGPLPGFTYDEGDTFISRGFVEEAGAVRVGVDFDGHTGIDHPYRWGLGSTLQPGQSVTISGGIRLNSAQMKNYWTGLVREQIAWLTTRQGTQTIVVRSDGSQPPPSTLRQQIAELQAQVQQLQQQVAQVNGETDRLKATILQIKQTIQNLGL